VLRYNNKSDGNKTCRKLNEHTNTTDTFQSAIREKKKESNTKKKDKENDNDNEHEKKKINSESLSKKTRFSLPPALCF
jgi:hypothetical protein